MAVERFFRKVGRGVWGGSMLAAATALVSSCGGPTAPTQSARVQVVPDSASLQVGQQIALQATVFGSNGKPVQGPVYWSTEDPGVVAVSSDGVVTAEAAGQVQVAASSNGVNGSSSITVVAPSVASITIAPTSVSIDVGANVTLKATLYSASGHQLQAIPVAWASGNTGIATVTSSGQVTGLSPGTATILAAAEGQSMTATVTVTGSSHHGHRSSTVASIKIAPASVSVDVGSSATLQATAYDASGQQLQGVPVAWGTSNQGVATVSSSGHVTGVAAGTATISATAESESKGAGVTVNSSSHHGHKHHDH